MKFRSLPRVLMCLLAASVFFVSFSSEAAAQDARVTLNVKDVRMETVMVAIEEQTRYLFTVEDDVDIDVKVTVNVNNAPLSAALEQMVKGSDVVWTLKDRNPFRHGLSEYPSFQVYKNDMTDGTQESYVFLYQ